MKSFFTRLHKKLFSLLIICAVLSFFSNSAVAQCYCTTNYYGYYQGTIYPSCSNQNVSIPSTGWYAIYPTANVTYSISLSGGGWGGYELTVYYDNGSAWAPWSCGGGGSVYGYTFTPSSGALYYSGEMLIEATNGTGCYPGWIGNSATLSYQITPAYTPTISQSPASGTHTCVGSNITYTAGNSGAGYFSGFQYEWGGVGSWSGIWNPGNGTGVNPGVWTSCCVGSTLYVIATANNGGCTTNSSYVYSTMDALSSTGSFGSTLYTCNGGYTYNTSGVLTLQTITGYTGSILGWGYGSSSTCSADNSGYASNVGNATSPWSCCFPGGGNTSTLMVEVQNGVCSPAQSCYTFTQNVMTAPSSVSISPAGPVCAPSSGNLTLTYSGGGSSALPATLKWYSGSCGGTYLGSGQSLSVANPGTTTTYYAAWVDPCGVLTSCASATYTVVQNPGLSAASYSICQGSTTTLSPTTGGTWASNNTAVATVSGSTVGGVAAGSTTFNFTTSASPGCTYSTSAVSVTNKPTVSINAPTTFCTNATTTLSPSSGGTWVSNNTAAATVSGNTVTGATAGGTATFTFTTSTSPNCANTTASSVTVTPLPTVYSVTGGGTYCLGSGSAVGLSGSQTGVNYQLYVGGVAIGSPVAGTGAAIPFGNQSTVGTYTVVATTTTNSCVQNMSGNAVVTELSPNVTNNPGASGIGTNGATLNGTD